MHTKFGLATVTCFKDMMGSWMSHMTLTKPLSGMVYRPLAWTCYAQPIYKICSFYLLVSDIAIFVLKKDVKLQPTSLYLQPLQRHMKWQKPTQHVEMSSQQSLKVSANNTIQKSACYKFRLAFQCYYIAILHHFWNTGWKLPILTYPTCIWHSCSRLPR